MRCASGAKGLELQMLLAPPRATPPHPENAILDPRGLLTSSVGRRASQTYAWVCNSEPQGVSLAAPTASAFPGPPLVASCWRPHRQRLSDHHGKDLELGGRYAPIINAKLGTRDRLSTQGLGPIFNAPGRKGPIINARPWRGRSSTQGLGDHPSR